MKLVCAHVVLEDIDVRDLDDDFLVRLDVADRLREDVRPFLLEETRRKALHECLFVNRPCFSAAFDHADDPAITDDHGHIVHGRGMR